MKHSEFVATPPQWPHTHLRPRSETESATLSYVGQTVNIRNRFTQGYRRQNFFTHAKARYVHPRDIDRVERRLIRRLKPSENTTFTGRQRLYGVNG